MESVDFLIVRGVDADEAPWPISFFDVPKRPYVEDVHVCIYRVEVVVRVDEDVVCGSVIAVEVVGAVCEH